MKIVPLGDKAIQVQFSNTISPEINHQILRLSYHLQALDIEGITELVPAYRSVTLYYEPTLLTFDELVEKLTLAQSAEKIQLPPQKIIYIPTCYGGELGPDLKSVASLHQLSEESVIRIHSDRSYLIYMIGFTPGFPYLGGMSKKIATPRLDTPRKKVSAGSVGIAGEQTGIYSMETPGGWQIIGKTPLELFHPESNQPFLLQAGNYVRFTPITRGEYEEISSRVRKGIYKPRIETVEGGDDHVQD